LLSFCYFNKVIFGFCALLWHIVGGNRLDVNCKNTFEGAFQFHYERADNEGICNNPENRILACQSPGSSFKDNFVVKQTFSKCQGNAASVDSSMSNSLTDFDNYLLMNNEIFHSIQQLPFAQNILSVLVGI